MARGDSLVTGAPSVAVVSFRLGGTDGVAVEAAKWITALQTLGCRITTVAGEGEADHIVPGLAMSDSDAPDPDELGYALSEADVVIVENVCSLPLNPVASSALLAALDDRPAIFHHHDLPWERQKYAGYGAGWLPDSPGWRHVCITDTAQLQLGRFRHDPVRIYNAFDPDPRLGDRERARAVIGAAPHERVLLQPTRAIERKNIPAAIDLAGQLGATFWLLGEAEEDYGPELDRLLARAPGRVLQGRFGLSIEDAYAACDLVTLMSTWEGFGNPAIEAGLHGKAVVVGNYPVAAELAGLGFRWFSPRDENAVAAYFQHPDRALPAWNAEVARQYLSTTDLPQQIEGVLRTLRCFVGAG
jgi:glycosyltransferase involved in cell wall biosynthesis